MFGSFWGWGCLGMFWAFGAFPDSRASGHFGFFGIRVPWVLILFGVWGFSGSFGFPGFLGLGFLCFVFWGLMMWDFSVFSGFWVLWTCGHFWGFRLFSFLGLEFHVCLGLWGVWDPFSFLFFWGVGFAGVVAFWVLGFMGRCRLFWFRAFPGSGVWVFGFAVLGL